MTLGESKADDSEIVPTPPPTGFVEPVTAEMDGTDLRKGKARSKKRLYCFHCNRPEIHSNPYIGTWFYSYLIGLSFGLLHLIGPFRCQCCGRQRLMFQDWANPKFHTINARKRAAAPSSRRSRS